MPFMIVLEISPLFKSRSAELLRGAEVKKLITVSTLLSFMISSLLLVLLCLYNMTMVMVK